MQSHKIKHRTPSKFKLQMGNDFFEYKNIPNIAWDIFVF